jgi:hypothetical protein
MLTHVIRPDRISNDVNGHDDQDHLDRLGLAVPTGLWRSGFCALG